MTIAPTKRLVVQAGENGVPVLAEPVVLVNPDGTPFAGAPTAISWNDVIGKPETFPVAAAASNAWGGVKKQAAEAPLADGADAAAIGTKVNAILTKLTASGLFA